MPLQRLSTRSLFSQKTVKQKKWQKNKGDDFTWAERQHFLAFLFVFLQQHWLCAAVSFPLTPAYEILPIIGSGNLFVVEYFLIWCCLRRWREKRSTGVRSMQNGVPPTQYPIMPSLDYPGCIQGNWDQTHSRNGTSRLYFAAGCHLLQMVFCDLLIIGLLYIVDESIKGCCWWEKDYKLLHWIKASTV